MTVNLVVMPGSPALIRELSPGDDAGGRLLRALRGLLADVLSDHRREHGPATRIELVGSRDERWRTGVTGSFRAWGAPDVQVGAGHHLPELVQRYVLGNDAALVTGSRELPGTPDPAVLTLVAADGSAGLDDRAPLARMPGADAADQWCRQLLAGEADPGEWTAEALRQAGVIEPELWVELAGLRRKSAQLMDADISLGVGRYISAWEI